MDMDSSLLRSSVLWALRRFCSTRIPFCFQTPTQLQELLCSMFPERMFVHCSIRLLLQPAGLLRRLWPDQEESSASVVGTIVSSSREDRSVLPNVFLLMSLNLWFAQLVSTVIHYALNPVAKSKRAMQVWVKSTTKTGLTQQPGYDVLVQLFK